MRPRSQLCGPRCELVPQITSSTSEVLRSLRLASSRNTVEPSRCGWICDNAPLGYLPIPRGVRQASMIRASLMAVSNIKSPIEAPLCACRQDGPQSRTRTLPSAFHINHRVRVKPGRGENCVAMPGHREELNLHPSPFPEGLAHLAALDLAGGASGKFGYEVDRARHLEARELRADEIDNLLLQRIARLKTMLQHDDALHLFAPFLVGHADGADVFDGRMLDDLVVDFLGIDVDAARDDDLRRTSGEEEIIVLVEIADVAEREEFAAMRARRFLLVLVVAKWIGLVGFVIDETGLALGKLVAVLVHDLHAQQGRPLANAARFSEPLLGRDDEACTAFAAGIIFVEDRAQPFDHRALDFRRAGCCAMHKIAHR